MYTTKKIHFTDYGEDRAGSYRMRLAKETLWNYISVLHHDSNNLHFHFPFHFKVANTQIPSVYHKSVGVRYTTAV